MDPYYDEQRLRDEVIYLHSLWHQGPPTHTNPNPNPNPNPIHKASRHLQPSNPTQLNNEKTKVKRRGKRGKKNPPQSDPPPVSAVEPPSKNTADHNAYLKPSNPTQFKKEKKRVKTRARRAKKKPPQSDPPPASVVELPSQKTADTPSSSAPTLNPLPTPATQLLSPEEHAQVQQKALKAAQEFFAGNVDSDSDEVGGSNQDGYEEYKFFFKVFIEDSELRSYYEKNRDVGYFCCLVCCGVGKKVGKRFKHCVGLVQHAMEIGKTTKKRAHRAYARVICKILGWDIDGLPSTELLVHSPAKPESQGSLKVGDASNCMENLDNAVLSLADGNADGMVNCLEPSKDDAVGNETENNQKGIVVVNDLKENMENLN